MAELTSFKQWQQGFLGGERRPLDALLHPRSIAVLGAGGGEAGDQALRNLLDSPFGGTVYPVSPSRSNVRGIRAYARVSEVPEPVDLALLAVRAEGLPDAVGDCAKAGVAAAALLNPDTSGRAGPELRSELAERAGRMRLLGPDSLGLMRPGTGLVASLADVRPRPGSVAVLSQSRALCSAILDWSESEQLGFSAFVSVGSMIDVGWGDLIDYLGDDPATRSIVLYVETVGDARRFLSAAREVALSKPLILIKAGRTAEAAGQLGLQRETDEALDAACRRTGVLRVDEIEELFLMAELLGKQRRPRGSRLAVLTNARGPAALASDALLRSGGSLPAFSPGTLDALQAALPGRWSGTNPIDLHAEADAASYAAAMDVLARDEASDGLLVILSPQARSEPLAAAEAVAKQSKASPRPILASWMGGERVRAARQVLAEADVPDLPYPDTAARLFGAMARYSYNLEGIYETPALVAPPEAVADRAAVTQLVEDAARAGRTELSAEETGQLLAAYGITLRGTGGRRSGIPLRLASRVDPNFGPVMRLGLGGELAAAAGEATPGLPPLNATLARRMLEQTRVYPALAADEAGGRAAVEELLVRFSHLLVDQPRVRRVAIDPLWAQRGRAVAGAAEVSLHGGEIPPERLPRPAIRPYPMQYVGAWTLKNGTAVVIRPIRPEDEPMLVQFHHHLSEQTVQQRYFHMISLDARTTHQRLRRRCFIDYDREMALVAELPAAADRPGEIIGVGRLSQIHGTRDAEFAGVVSDAWQGQGLGSELLERMVDIARREGVERVVADVLAGNRRMLGMFDKLGFERERDPEEGVYHVELKLGEERCDAGR
ncbi:MAG: GNAT family N-acetyltransferase [Phycisphaeraceae bacterium]